MSVPLASTNECAICSEPLELEDRSHRGHRILQETSSRQKIIGHIFHQHCLADWFARSEGSSCPICRHEITPQEPQDFRLTENSENPLEPILVYTEPQQAREPLLSTSSKCLLAVTAIAFTIFSLSAIFFSVLAGLGFASLFCAMAGFAYIALNVN